MRACSPNLRRRTAGGTEAAAAAPPRQAAAPAAPRAASRSNTAQFDLQPPQNWMSQFEKSKNKYFTYTSDSLRVRDTTVLLLSRSTYKLKIQSEKNSPITEADGRSTEFSQMCLFPKTLSLNI